MLIVSGALIRNGRLLIGLRWPHVVKRWSNMWEIAGGKVQCDEGHREALRRELEEEYGFTETCISNSPIQTIRLPMPFLAEYSGVDYEVHTYRIWTDEIPEIKVHQGIKWATRADIEHLPCLSSLTQVLERAETNSEFLSDWE